MYLTVPQKRNHMDIRAHLQALHGHRFGGRDTPNPPWSSTIIEGNESN